VTGHNTVYAFGEPTDADATAERDERPESTPPSA